MIKIDSGKLVCQGIFGANQRAQRARLGNKRPAAIRAFHLSLTGLDFFVLLTEIILKTSEDCHGIPALSEKPDSPPGQNAAD